MRIECYKKPTVQFVLNKLFFNNLMEILTFNEKNCKSETDRETAKELKNSIYEYCIPIREESNEVAIVDIYLFSNEASKLIEQILYIGYHIEASEDYTKYIKHK